MKILFLFLVLFSLSGCGNQSSASGTDNYPPQPSPTIDNANKANQNAALHGYKIYEVDEIKLKELALQNQQFEQVSDEFKGVDFKNFKYPDVRLKNGEYDDFNPQNPLAGRLSYNLTNLFFIDLFGDDKKEAVVFLYSVSCGASCDGGSDIIYFYSSQNGKAKLIDEIETGSNSGGCSLKSFTIKDKKIFVEQFGKCIKDSAREENRVYTCKFCVEDETHTVFSMEKNGLKKESFKIIETGQVNVMNSPALISINN